MRYAPEDWKERKSIHRESNWRTNAERERTKGKRVDLEAICSLVHDYLVILTIIDVFSTVTRVSILGCVLPQMASVEKVLTFWF
jgi:hypothetical protein